MKTLSSRWSAEVARSLREHTQRERQQEAGGSATLAALLELVNGVLQSPARPSPQTFGPYQLGEKVGEGSTSVVYRVLGEGSEPLVLRRMKLHDPSPKAVERFTRSLRITRERLDHPNILRPLEVGEHEGKPFAILPYLDTLERQLACEEWPLARCARVMYQLASAVAHAHERGVIHYDLKPANVLWRPAQDGGDGVPLLIDFDSARLLDPAEHGSSTWAAGGATRCYLAPELLAGGEATVRADIYSLGVIFHEMLTSELPDGARAGQRASHARRRALRRPRSAVPRYFQAVCEACLEQAPSARYPSAAELVRDLEHLLRGERPRRYKGRLLRALDWASAHRGRSLGSWGAAACSAALVWQLLDPGPLSSAQSSAVAASELAAELGAELQHLARAAEETAKDPEVVSRLDLTSPINLDRALLSHIIDPITRESFSGSFVMTSNARIMATYPGVAEGVLEKTYPWRDYFIGALRLGNERPEGARAAYLSRAFRSETSERLELGFSVPMPETGPVRGVLVTQLIARDVLRERHQAERTPHSEGRWPRARALLRLVLGRPEPLERVSVLLGPRDRDRRDGETGILAPEGLTYLAHPDMDPRAETRLAAAYEKPLLEALGPAAARGEQFQPSPARPVLFEEYSDPYRLGERSSADVESLREWSAAAAPILRTGYAVLVQSSRPSPAESKNRFLARFVVSLLGMGAVIAGLMFARRGRELLR